MPPDLVLASMVGGIVVIAPSGAIDYVNPAAEALLGKSRRSTVGRTVEDVFADRPWVLDLVQRVREDADSSLRDEGNVGTERDHAVVCVATAIRSPKSEDSGICLALHDLTTRHKLERDRAAHARVEEQDRMIATVAHEINNPLSGIRGAAQLLGKKLDEKDDLAAYAGMIVRQADRMSDLISPLLGLSATLPAMEPVNIHRVLNEVILVGRAEARERGVEFKTEYDPSLPEILGNADQLEQLFLNLTKNALAVCPKGRGRVRLTTRMDNSFYVTTSEGRTRYLAVEVTDNGPGFDEAVGEEIFTPFYTKTEGGHGLGLAVARNVAMAHRGQIHAENSPAGGACFRVTLPVAEISHEEVP